MTLEHGVEFGRSERRRPRQSALPRIIGTERVHAREQRTQLECSPGSGRGNSGPGTVTTAANLDCTLASYFTLTGTAGDAVAMTFGTGGSSGAFSCQLGQVIRIRVTASGSTVNTLTWSGYTITWVGVLTSTGGTSASAPVLATSGKADITLVCTGTGSTPTFDGSFVVGI